MTLISLKFGGQVFYGVQTDSSKFGVICLKIKVRRIYTVKHSETASLHHICKKINILLSDVIILNDVTVQFSL